MWTKNFVVFMSYLLTVAFCLFAITLYLPCTINCNVIYEIGLVHFLCYFITYFFFIDAAMQFAVFSRSCNLTYNGRGHILLQYFLCFTFERLITESLVILLPLKQFVYFFNLDSHNISRKCL